MRPCANPATPSHLLNQPHHPGMWPQRQGLGYPRPRPHSPVLRAWPARPKTCANAADVQRVGASLAVDGSCAVQHHQHMSCVWHAQRRAGGLAVLTAGKGSIGWSVKARGNECRPPGCWSAHLGHADSGVAGILQRQQQRSASSSQHYMPLIAQGICSCMISMHLHGVATAGRHFLAHTP